MRGSEPSGEMLTLASSEDHNLHWSSPGKILKILFLIYSVHDILVIIGISCSFETLRISIRQEK